MFFKSNYRYTAYGGARGGGKSWAMRTKLVILALCHPGINILLLRRTLGELRENHIIPLKRLLFNVADYRETAREFLFPNHSRIKLGYLDTDGDALQYQGQAYEVIGMEEATQFTCFQFNCLTECNRYSGGMSTPFKPRMYFTCNPGGVGSDWVKRLFIDKIYRPGENPEDYYFIKSLVYDNAYLMKHDPGYVRVLEALPETRKRAMLYGDWNAFEGMFFPEFDEKTHVKPPFHIPSDYLRFRSLDYGLDMTACLWFAAAPGGKLIVYRELYKSGLILSEAARLICEATPRGEVIRYTAASPDLWNRRQDSGKSGAAIMAENGLLSLRKADSSRVAGWRVVREYLKDRDDGPNLIILSRCKNLIRCLPLLAFDKDLTEDASDKPHEITHAPESLRYGLMSRVPKLPPPTRKPFSALYSFESRRFPQTEEISDYIFP
ncbi:MAG: phage terminase large subunit [Eubacteriales bacterium]